MDILHLPCVRTSNFIDDFSHFGYLYLINEKGKLNKTKKKRQLRVLTFWKIYTLQLMDILHLPCVVTSNFIDDFSHFGYLYLINEKSNTFENLKTFKTKVEKQSKKAIKIVRSD